MTHATIIIDDPDDEDVGKPPKGLGVIVIRDDSDEDIDRKPGK